MAVLDYRTTCELNRPVTIKHLDGMFFSQDVQANRIVVSVVRGGVNEDLSGTVSANIIRADGETVVQTGEISGNVASVTMPAAAYAVPGAIAVFVKHTQSGVTSTIAAVTGYVYKSTTDTIVDPGTIIPSIQDLLESIDDAIEDLEEAIAAIPQDYQELEDEVSDLKSAIESIETATDDIPKTRDSDATGIDLDVSDTNGNVLVRFSGGHIKTKNFNSANTFPFPAPINSDADLAISDVNGNALALFRNGQIQTKNFDSKYIRQLTGKKWTCLGDSLTEHNQRTTMNYHDYIAQETGITVFNLGHSGCGYAKTGGNGQKFVDQAGNIPNDTDVITIFGSGNDGSSGLGIGNPTDNGTTTICGYINATIDVIYANHPVTALGIITPTPWANREPSDGQTWMKDYSEAIIAICTLRGIPCLDLWHCSNLHPTDVSFRPLAYSKDDGDGVHPDETGHALIAPRIRQFLFSLI